jgi:hypothetical protein
MNKVLLVGGTAVVSLAAGAVGGYFFAKYRLGEAYQIVLEEEVERTKAYWRQRSQTGGFDSPIDAARALLPEEKPMTVEEFAAIAKDLGYVPGEENEAAQQLLQNIFEGGEDELDDDAIAAEEAARTPDEPYIISVEEYMHNESGHRQFTLTYFEGDGTLVDEHEKPIDETEKYVGENNLTRFGHRSKDRNTLYIRNDKAEMEFEIVRSQRSYTEDVLGFVKKDKKPPQRMRRADA